MDFKWIGFTLERWEDARYIKVGSGLMVRVYRSNKEKPIGGPSQNPYDYVPLSMLDKQITNCSIFNSETKFNDIIQKFITTVEIQFNIGD